MFCRHFFSVYFLNALQSDNNSNRVYVLGHKYIFGPFSELILARAVSLSRAQNIFMPANINSIVLFYSLLPAACVVLVLRKSDGLLPMSHTIACFNFSAGMDLKSENVCPLKQETNSHIYFVAPSRDTQSWGGVPPHWARYLIYGNTCITNQPDRRWTSNRWGWQTYTIPTLVF